MCVVANFLLPQFNLLFFRNSLHHTSFLDSLIRIVYCICKQLDIVFQVNDHLNPLWDEGTYQPSQHSFCFCFHHNTLHLVVDSTNLSFFKLSIPCLYASCFHLGQDLTVLDAAFICSTNQDFFITLYLNL